MRKWWLLLFSVALFGRVHKVPIEPYEIYHYRSAVAGWVLASHTELEGKKLFEQEIISLDDSLDRANLKRLEAKISNLQKILKSERDQLQVLKELARLKKSQYLRIKDLKTKSLEQKERRLSDYLNAQRAYLAQRVKIKNLQNQRQDLLFSIEKVKDSIKKKHLIVSGYIYKIYVTKGDFVNPGTKLADIADTSKAKIVLYLDKEEIERLKKGSFYLDGIKSHARIIKILSIPDTRHLGEYRAEFLVPKPKIFGKFIDVEIK